jgi:hypothetical protein
MKVRASNPQHRARYVIFLDGIDVSDCVTEADDIAHEVTVVVRRPNGEKIYNQGRQLTAVVRGYVAIVSRVDQPAMENPS